MAAIQFNDGTFSTLRNRFAAPGDRFGSWTPITRPVGDTVNRLSDGLVVMFRERTDYGASFELAGIPVVNSPPPTGLAFNPVATGGSIPAGTYYYVVTAVDDG